MAYNTPGEVLTDIANSIRGLYSSTDSIPFVDMPGLIKGAIGSPIDISDCDGTNWILPFVEHLNFDGISNITGMFSYIDCDAETPTHSLNLKNLSVNGLNSLSELFMGSKFTEILGIEDWDTTNITNINSIFYDTHILGSLDLSGWDVSNARFDGTYQSIYAPFCSTTIADLDLSGWDFSSGQFPLQFFFWGATIQNLNLSNWKIPSVSLMQMFNGATIGSLDLTGWDTSGVTSMYYMFDGASVTKMWVPSTFVYTGAAMYGSPFSRGNLVIYTDASSASEQGWGSTGSNVVHYNSTYQDFINA